MLLARYLATASVAALSLSPLSVAALSLSASTAAMAQSADSGTMERAKPDMKLVLQKLKDLGAKPVSQLTVEQARTQPTPADAVKAVLTDMGKSTAPEQVGSVKDITIPGPGGDIPARVYIPAGKGPFPVVLYFHGGGWVIATLDTYDASPRAVSSMTGAIVVSADYRHAPESKFPAAHDDANAAYKWVVEHVGQFNGDTKRIAVMGESAGGNLAANVTIAARDMKLQMPVAQILVYPVAGSDMTTPSYVENADAMPLGKKDMMWFVDKVLPSMDDAKDPRINLVAADLKDLPAATIITAEIDPLRSEGQMLADKLKAAGVETESMNYPGVTHEFFGMGAVVGDAELAQVLVAKRLKAAFGSM